MDRTFLGKEVKVKQRLISFVSRKFILKLLSLGFGWWGFQKILAKIQTPSWVLLVIYFAFLLTLAGLYDFANLGINKIMKQ